MPWSECGGEAWLPVHPALSFPWGSSTGVSAGGPPPDTFSYSVLLSIHYVITARICRVYFYPFFLT